MSYDIEKKSLEAHVEICAERYKGLTDKLNGVDNKVQQLEDKVKKMDETIDTRIDNLEKHMTSMFDELKSGLFKVITFRNNQLIGWGVSIISVLVSAVSALLFLYLGK
jgi:predicted RNase H-like nuclease (RuvC/YqgF family)